MEKKIFKLLLFIIFICDISYAEIINDIKIFGNKRIANETVLVLGEILFLSKNNLFGLSL